MPTFGPNASYARWKALDGQEHLLRVTSVSRFALVLEHVNPEFVPRASQLLSELQVVLAGRQAYQGRAVVAQAVSRGAEHLLTVTLDTPGLRMDAPGPGKAGAKDREAYEAFARRLLLEYKIAPEFKVLVADVHHFLTEIRLWLEQVALQLGDTANGSPGPRERELLAEITPPIFQTFNARHERFEELAYAIPPELRGIHQELVRRYWQPLLLCSPFGFRTYQKPLGYAGDYEMMNMIYRNQPEGQTLFARLMHLMLVSQWPARSVRHRVAHLKQAIIEETARVSAAGGRARILNVGCGSAREIQEFLGESALSDRVDFLLVDFNAETLAHAGQRLEELRGQFGRRARIETRQMTVLQLLRRGAQREDGALEESYDLIYCAGLFDYLAVDTCRALTNLFYHSLRPGGLALVANMDDAQPFRNIIEFVLDWHLIYRDSRALRQFIPEPAREGAAVIAEPVAVNLFLHLRKPGG